MKNSGPFSAVRKTALKFVLLVGELLGYDLRLVSGKVSEKTQQFWPMTLFGYLIQMVAVPLLALALSTSADDFEGRVADHGAMSPS